MVDAFTESDYAGLARRVVAWGTDLVAYSVAWSAGLVALTLANGGELHLQDGPAFWVVVLPAIAWSALWIASPVRGTPGHRIAGIRVVRPDGSRVSLARAVGRTLAEGATYLVFVLGVVASGVTILASRRHQAIHDMVAGTVCVEGEALERASSVQRVPTAAQVATPTASTSATPVVQRPQTTEERHRGPFL